MRLSEVYVSIQGEGPHVGEPTTFVRFGGCNLRCPGWGFGNLPDGTVVPGCDTTFAVYPEWRNTWDKLSPGDIVSQIPADVTYVCLTGGEPLTQRSTDLASVVYPLLSAGHLIDVFTNGSQLITDHAWWDHPGVSFIMDYKLPGSGEFGSFKDENLLHLGDSDWLKFVIKDRDDFDTAVFLARKWQRANLPFTVAFGPVWELLDSGTLIDWVLEDVPWAVVNTQMHKYIWDPIERKR